MTDSPLQKWDIWTAYVPFEQKPGGKIRPVIILSETEEELLILVIPVSSHQQKNRVGGYRELLHWSEAGLDKPSSALCNNIVRLPKKNLKNHIGRLHGNDIDAVAMTVSFWNNIY